MVAPIGALDAEVEGRASGGGLGEVGDGVGHGSTIHDNEP